MTPDPARHARASTSTWRSGRLRLVPRSSGPRLAVEGAVSPELAAVLHFTLLTVLRPTVAPVAVADDLRLAVDEVLAVPRRGGATVAAEVVVDGRSVSLAVTVPWEVPDSLPELVAPLVDDLEHHRGSLGTVVTMRRSW